MNWSRSGQQQRAKAKEQYAMMGPNPGLTYMVKNGFIHWEGSWGRQGETGSAVGPPGEVDEERHDHNSPDLHGAHHGAPLPNHPRRSHYPP